MDDDTVPRLRRARAEQAARAVLPACAGVWTAAEIMHAVSVAQLDVGLGAATLAGIAYGKGARRTAVGLVVAGAWSLAATRFGPLADPGLYCPLTGAWAVLSFCGWRWARRHPDVLAAIEKRNAAADWLDRRGRWGLRGSHLLDWQETRLGEWYLIDVRGTGKRASAIVHSDVAERIAEDLILPQARVRLRKHGLAGRVEISVRRTDPWAKPILHPATVAGHEIDLSGRYSITQPAIVGQDPETGKPLVLQLCTERGGRNVSVVAILEAGKTTLLSCISERVTAANDALLFRINLSIKGDTERQLWAPACHLTALGPGEAKRAAKLLRIVARIVQWRAQQPKTSANWQPTPRDPHLVLVIDEIDALAELPGCKALLKHLSSKGREFGVTIVRAGQRGTADWTGGGDVRALDGVFCIGMVNRSSEAMHAAGDLGLQLPNMAEYGEGQPGVWAIAELSGRHHAGRAFNLCEPDDIRELVAKRAHHQPDLQPELQAFLGKAYEELLSTDVYARWARGLDVRPVIAHTRPDTPPEPGPATSPEPDRSPVALLTDDSLSALDQEADDVLTALPDDLRERWLKQGETLAQTRRVLEEAAKDNLPDIPHEQQAAYAEAQWRALGEATDIPVDHQEPLLRLLAAGTTIREVSDTLGVSKWIARTYLERLRADGRVRMEGEKRTARWFLNEPAGGDGS